MQLIPQRERAAPSPKFAAPSVSTPSIQADGEPHCSADDGPTQSLRLDLARHGVAVAGGDGQRLILSGPGFLAREVPDLRCAYILLRQMNGGARR